MNTNLRLQEIVNNLIEKNIKITIDNIIQGSLFTTGGTITDEKIIKEFLKRYNIIKKEIGTTSKAYKFNETKKEVINQYAKVIIAVNELTDEKFNNYSFLSEVLRKCEIKEKQSKVSNLLQRVYRLERHTYSPEQNKLHFVQGKEIIYVKVPQKTTIDEALTYIMQSISLDQLQKFM